MGTRTARLPGGWYPRSEAEWDRLFPAGSEDPENVSGSLVAGIVPHAGWFFSGELMLGVISRIPEGTELVLIAGGHLLPGTAPLFWDCDAVETPFGILPAERDFSRAAAQRIGAVPDTSSDNTVEVVMPALARLCPHVKVAGFRIPPDMSALEAGAQFAALAEEAGLRTVVIGSTDLTHYGPNYGFSPEESHANPAAWVGERDRRFLDALTAGEGSRALTLANDESSACSAGGAVAAFSFARNRGVSRGTLLGYGTSLDKMRGESFVGYGAAGFFS